jgi:hypothetical protein
MGMNELVFTTGDETIVKMLTWRPHPRNWAGTCQSNISLLEANGGIFTVFACHGICLKQQCQLFRSCFL